MRYIEAVHCLKMKIDRGYFPLLAVINSCVLHHLTLLQPLIVAVFIRLKMIKLHVWALLFYFVKLDLFKLRVLFLEISVHYLLLSQPFIRLGQVWYIRGNDLFPSLLSENIYKLKWHHPGYVGAYLSIGFEMHYWHISTAVCTSYAFFLFRENPLWWWKKILFLLMGLAWSCKRFYIPYLSTFSIANH